MADDFKKRLDEILNGFEEPDSSMENPADEEFERPSNFPEKVEMKELDSVLKESMNNSDMGDDYAYIRSLLRHLIEKGLLTLDGAINIAKETENARSIEVISQIMNSISDLSTKLVKLHDSAQEKMDESGHQGMKGKGGVTNVYVLEKGKDSKHILDNLLGEALEGKATEIKEVNERPEDKEK